MPGITGFTLGSLDLRTLAHEIRSANGWDSFPGLKARGVRYAYTHGEDNSGRRFYKARDIDIDMVLMATNSAGAVTTSPAEHVQDNIDSLLGALHSTSGELLLTRTLPDASTRTADVRPLDFTRVRQNGILTRRVVLSLRMGYPLWHGAADSVSGAGPLSPDNTGNAPVNDMVITFTTAGRITDDASGDYVEAATAGTVLDVGTGEITVNPSNDISERRPWFLQFEPGVNALTITGGSKTINWNHGYF